MVNKSVVFLGHTVFQGIYIFRTITTCRLIIRKLYTSNAKKLSQQFTFNSMSSKNKCACITFSKQCIRSQRSTTASDKRHPVAYIDSSSNVTAAASTKQTQNWQ